ncbi:uncharacterized protein BYT42DRAFT_621760 [Radiomyces spectabilis]|uniref:uncharacterized protein n=1 Tax=Radiomyces spectabilis TaxID=64574 RepID=UPI00221FFD76|nr:uncharacterized protein BYT42DRAFT_621760 [Radiomyces spectabilis]KAI8373053.1 hypothetical protein BYT42DRAFT_621760 [Radiomyces spectabilis]
MPCRFFSTTRRVVSPLRQSQSQLRVFEPLQHHAPTFYMKGHQVKPLYQPHEFYSELKSRILSAKDRIFIAALYIGHAEKELVDTLRTALSRSSSLKAHILIDCLRGTRVSKGQSSATLLLPLLQDFPNQVKVSMYHTPDLTGVLKKTLPQRFNETIGLMHMKVYGFDNTVMLSGYLLRFSANLSLDYFTNRQDRYMLFDDHAPLASYYAHLLETVGSFSYQLDNPVSGTEHSYSLVSPADLADPIFDSRRFKHQQDTAVLPVVQMGPFGIRQDENICLELLDIAHRTGGKSPENWWIIHLTSGYFNFTDRYKTYILKTRAYFRFLTASPEANGFFNSKGVSRFLPPAYTFIERQFYKNILRLGKQDMITIEEYKRPGWTYHAKGLWVCFPSNEYPSLTMIGSPNFGHRSSERDLETQAVVITQNEKLQQALHKEVNGLHEHSDLVTKDTFKKMDRRVPYGVRLATAVVKTML